MDIITSIPVWGYALISVVLPFLFVLTIVVFFHELGHYLAGRWNKFSIEAFSVGFGPEMFGFNDKHGTRWKFCWIPLGGYVRFLGDANASSEPDFDKIEQLPEAQKAGAFDNKKVWERAIVVAAGPAASFLLAIVIFAASYYIQGRYISDPVVFEVVEGSAAEEAGFMPGDMIKSIDGVSVESFGDIPVLVSPNHDLPLSFLIDRDGRELVLTATPRKIERVDRFGNTIRQGMIGITHSYDKGNLRNVEMGLVDSITAGTAQTWSVVTLTMGYLKDIIVGRQDADQLSGPLGIAKTAYDVSTIGFAQLITLAGFLSASIGLLNLFPIPMLDGGHLLFYAIEAVKGSPLSQRMQTIGYKIGLTLVLMLMLFATRNDLLFRFSNLWG